MASPYNFSVQSYVPLGVTFDSSETNIPPDQIWIAVFGQLIFNQGGGTVPDGGNSFYLDATQLNTNKQPIPQFTSALPPAGVGNPDGAIIPSFTLAEWGANLNMPIPAYTPPAPDGLTQFTGRILISIGTPVQSLVNADGSVSPPSASNPTDPSTGTFCDFLEFTVQSNSDNSNNVDVDTSQVDSFGLPMQLQFFKDAKGTEPFNLSFTGNTTSGSNTITNLNSFSSSIQADALITGNGIPTGSFITAINSDRTTITLGNNATATVSNVALTAVYAGPVGVAVSRDVIFGTGNLSFSQFLTTISKTQSSIFQACAPPNQTAAPLRLISPKDLAEIYTASPYMDSFNNYFNALIDEFFLYYFSGTVGTKQGGGNTFSIQSGASGTLLTYTGSVVLSGSNYVLQLQDPTKKETYTIYYPFFSGIVLNNYTPVFPVGPCPGWIPSPKESPSQMVFACDGVFADNTKQPAGTFNTLVLGDLENSISAAFNRGIALTTPTTNWNIVADWYNGSATSNNGYYNYWVQYWHQNGLAENGMAYAFAYDDKFGTSTNLQQNSVGLIQVTLGSWGNKLLPSITITPPAGIIIQGGPISLNAKISGSGAAPTGTITFYMNGYPINPNGYPSAAQPSTVPVTIVNNVAQQNANCPPLPDGANTHTYTLTAVYSGDANYLPFVAALPVQVSKPTMFIFNPNPPSIILGQALPNNSAVQFSAVSVNGNVEISTWILGATTTQLGSSTTLAATANPVPVSSLVVPALSFTGNLSASSETISGVSSVTGLSVGQLLSGTGIPANTQILTIAPSVGNNSITMNNKATQSGNNVTINSAGENYSFQFQAVYTPTGGQPQLPATTYNFTPVAG